MVLRLLERFLRAGVEPEAALRTLNDAMTLRGAETGTFTTIDLVRLDLQSAQATVYKYGAAPSYLKHGPAHHRQLPARRAPHHRPFP